MRSQEVARSGKEYISNRSFVLFRKKKKSQPRFYDTRHYFQEQIHFSVHPSLLPEQQPAILSAKGNILLTHIDPLHCKVTRLHLD